MGGGDLVVDQNAVDRVDRHQKAGQNGGGLAAEHPQYQMIKRKADQNKNRKAKRVITRRLQAEQGKTQLAQQMQHGPVIHITDIIVRVQLQKIRMSDDRVVQEKRIVVDEKTVMEAVPVSEQAGDRQSKPDGEMGG